MLIYAVGNEPDRTTVALDWLSREGCIGVQVLNEFVNTARRTLDRSWDDVIAASTAIRTACNECLSITEQTHAVAVELSRRQGFIIYDSLIAASASEAKCSVLVTENMQHGQRIGDTMRVRNPFRL